MINYWYLSRINEYPQPSWHIKSVQLNHVGTIIEMDREADEDELLTCDLIYLGRGQWHDEHIQNNYEGYVKMICR